MADQRLGDLVDRAVAAGRDDQLGPVGERLPSELGRVTGALGQPQAAAQAVPLERGAGIVGTGRVDGEPDLPSRGRVGDQPGFGRRHAMALRVGEQEACHRGLRVEG